MILAAVVVVASRNEDSYVVERARRIEAPPEEVYELVANFRNWRRWSPWEEVDPNMNRTYEGPTAGIGAAYEWKGNRKAGAGRMTILESSTPTRIDIELEFLTPFKSRATTSFKVSNAGAPSVKPGRIGPARFSGAAAETDDGAAAKVTWSIFGNHSLASKVIALVTPMDKMIGPDFERGLDGLAAAAETSPAAPAAPAAPTV